MSDAEIQVLIVDDDEDDSLLTYETLRDVAGVSYVVTRIHNPVEAGNVIHSSEFDIVLCDYRMGAMNGIDFIRNLRSQGLDIPIILLTGVGDQETDKAALAAGASDFMSKSALTPELIDRAIRYSIATASRQRLLETVLNYVTASVALVGESEDENVCNSSFRDLALEFAPQMAEVDAVAAFGRYVTAQADTIEFNERVLDRRVRTMQNGSMVLVLHDVTERARFMQQLSAALEAAEAASYAKSMFLANMSHELRTPLNSIIGFGTILCSEKRHTLSDGCRQEYGQLIIEAGNHLRQIISDLLDISRIEMDAIALDEADVDVGQVARNCFNLLCSRAAEKEIGLRSQGIESLPVLQGDEQRIRQAIINLIDNALKFTPRGGQITLAGNVSTGGDVHISIRDTGPGIAAEHLDKIFEVFGQVEDGLSRIHQGVGLGLPLVKQFMELHGGAVEVSSEAGAGAEFVLTFPAWRVVASTPDRLLLSAARA